MSSDIDIHQLDSERQVLCILKESGNYLSIPKIKDKLLSLQISPETREMKSILNSLRNKRRKLLKNGLIHKDGPGYKIMQKGIEYLNNTVIIINPSAGESSHKTIGNLLKNLSGDIKICDPYFDDIAYNLLKTHLLPDKLKSVKIVHSKKRIEPTSNYRIKNISIELKKKNGIHDRFILDKDYLYFFGTSLNGIGNKLSFIFNLTVYKKKFDDIFQSYWNES